MSKRRKPSQKSSYTPLLAAARSREKRYLLHEPRRPGNVKPHVLVASSSLFLNEEMHCPTKNLPQRLAQREYYPFRVRRYKSRMGESCLNKPHPFRSCSGQPHISPSLRIHWHFSHL